MSVRQPGVRPCPCGGASYASCCEPLHDGRQEATTALELMRSRYSAFAVGKGNYLFRSWDPATRPDSIEASALEWTGLEILEVVAGQAGDDTGIVEFVASYRGGQLHERSLFRWRRTRWVYVAAAS